MLDEDDMSETVDNATRVTGSTIRQEWQDWLKKFEDGQLTVAEFRNYWALHVPRLFAINPEESCLSPRFPEQEIEFTLLNCLEKFITSSTDPVQVVKLLKQNESPSSFCGRVFKPGEPTYSCRDCSVDPTCVLCAGCFKASEHSRHKYKMNISRGGGYCDCGDQEAWKSAHVCETHDKDPILDNDIIPQDMQARLRLVTESALTYAYQILTWTQYTQLPTDLEVSGDPGDLTKHNCVTLLYNDEMHTYEQVITALHRAIEVSEREAVDFAATVDREGRAIIKIGQFTECTTVKHSLERVTGRRGGKPLKTMVIIASLISHQTFASRLLQWIDNFTKQLRGFSRILGQVLITVPTNPIDVYPLVRCVMEHDTSLWKAARSLWHQLIINGILMDPDCKTKFAKMFTRDYPDLMKDFVADDHDHAVSILSLSVQIFSVISLSHKLIAEDGAISALMRTFLSECAHNKNEQGRLAFDRNQNNQTFRRAQYVLYDLKYILYVKPATPWSENMKRSFSSGLENVLQLLSMMQGMDSVVRQVGQHVEFEAEWETGINIQLKLSSVLSMLVEWCEQEKDMLIRAIRKTLSHLIKADKSCSKEVKYITQTLGNHSASVIQYDVSTQPISIHLPLSRFLSGLLLAAQKFEMDYSSHLLEIEDKPSLVQIMEQALRTQVMVAQFRAGMWRRNGYSLLNQVFFYQNFRLRTETYDRDISLIQYCAAKMEPNEFLIHVLNKFDLISWFSRLDYSMNVNDIPDNSAILADDFLSLLLALISERHLPGVGDVTEEDRIKKEVIQLLSIDPLPHSQLVKQLPARYDDSAMEIILESALKEVAIFKKANTMGTVGKYEIKPDYYKFFNPFFYHYSREDQSRAEEVQLKRRRTAGLAPFCPPAALPNFTDEFKPILNLLDCDIFQTIVATILHRCTQGSLVYSDAQLERLLHLIGIGLNEVAQGTLSKSFADRMMSLKNEMDAAAKKTEENSSIRALLNFIIQKMTTPIGAEEADPANQPECSGVRNKRERNAELAKARRAKIMAQMSAQQKNFIKEYADMFQEDEIAPKETEEQKPRFTCILCREEEILSVSSKSCLVVSALVQKSAVLQKSKRAQASESNSSLSMGLPPSDLSGGAHISTCGHVMHSDCWEKYFETVNSEERRRPVRYGRHVSFDVNQLEFLCPLCKCLSNSVIPIVACQREDYTGPVKTETDVTMTPSSVEAMEGVTQGKITLSDWLDNVRRIAETAAPLPAASVALEEEDEEAKPNTPTRWATQDGKLTETPQIELTEKTIDMLRKFCNSITKVKCDGTTDNPFLQCVWTLAYTIQSTEWCIRVEDKALLADISSRKLYCLENFVKATHSACVNKILDGENICSSALQALRCLLLPQIEVDSCILEMDPFGVLCLLHFSLHTVTKYDTFSLDKNLLSLVIALHLVQVIISLYLQKEKPANEDVEMVDPAGAPSNANLERMSEFAGEVLLVAGLSANSRFPQASRIIEALVPFLRSVTLLQYFISPRDCDQNMRNAKLNDTGSLLNFIGMSIDHIDSIIRCRPLRELALSWARQPKVLHLATSNWKPIYPLKVNSLINLPTDYSELINYVALLTCPSSEGEVNILGDEVRTPTMCLVCGAVLCSQSYCCQSKVDNERCGACVAHAVKCSAGIGVFLRIRDCKVLLLVGRNKGSYSQPPYVDEYGETDPGLSRGNPLSLCSSAYTQLNQLWLSHGVPEQVAHALELSTSLSATNWHLM